MKKLTTIDAEAVSQRYSVKMVFLEISQNSQEISCNFIKKEALAQVLPCEFCETSKNTFSTEHPRTTASDYSSVEGQFCVNHLHTFTKISLIDLEELKILSLIRTFTF